MADVRARLTQAFCWRDGGADVAGWWADPSLLRDVGPALATLYEADSPTTVDGPAATGFIAGCLTAVALGVGFVEIRKDDSGRETNGEIVRRTTPPDYLRRNVTLSAHRRDLRSGQRVLFVDEWMATAGQAIATRRIVEDCGAEWVGAAVIVDATDYAARRSMGVRGLLRLQNLL